MNGHDADAKRFGDFRLGLPLGRESIRRQQFGLTSATPCRFFFAMAQPCQSDV